MTTRYQTLRSSLKGVRPAGGTREAGELYVNFADRQLGMINAAKAPVDLLAVRYFATTSDYAVGDYVVQAGQLYRSLNIVAAGAFNAADWVAVSMVPSDLLNAIKTVDGVGSGLDADLLDGLDSTVFATNANLVATYAPLADPVFTGNPRITTTPPNTDSDTSIASTAFVHSVRLDQMAQPFASIGMNGQLITALATPVNPTDAANKTYVDGQVATKLSDAASDGNIYGRKNGAWAITAAGLPDAPNDANAYVRSGLAWVLGYSKAAIDALLGSKVTTTADARNRVVNPAMQVSQENGNGTGTGTGFYAADQWPLYWVASGAALAHLRVGGTTPKGSLYRLRCNVNTPKASLAAGDYMQWLHAIEGIHIVDFNWGTVAAKPVILRFGIKAPAGTYSIAIRNGALNRCYIQTFTVTAGQANLDTEFTLVIPGDTAGTWNVDNTVGLYLSITMAAGSSMVAGVTGWQAGQFIGLTGMTNGIAASASIELFDVGLYLDPNVTNRLPAWQLPNENDEFLRCQRYYQLVSLYWCGSVTSLSAFYAAMVLPVQTRISSAALSGQNIGNAGFPAPVGTLNLLGTWAVRETRTATATGAAQIWGSNIIVNARM